MGTRRCARQKPGAAMDDVTIKDDTQTGQSWPLQIYKTLKAYGVRADLLCPRCRPLPADQAVACRSRYPDHRADHGRGRASRIAAGAWLGGERSGAADAIERRRQLHEHVVTRRERPASLPDAGDDARRMGGVQPVADPDGSSDGSDASNTIGRDRFMREDEPEDAAGDAFPLPRALAFESRSADRGADGAAHARPQEVDG